MERVQRKTEELKKLHRQHLLPGFDEDDRYSEEQQIDKLAREIAQSLQSCDLGVKQISAPGGQRRLSSQEARVRGSAQTSLATRLHGLTKRYRKEQDSYISKLEKQHGGGDGGDAVGRGRSRLDPFADDDDSGGGGLQSSQQLENANEEEIRLRDSEISKVARSVQEIATLMQDLAGLVIDQVCP
jgi:syntaxin 16